MTDDRRQGTSRERAGLLDEQRLDTWSSVLGTLSLDLTRGLWGRMGLDVPDEEALRALVREGITRGRGSAEEPEEIVARLVEEVLAGVGERFGEEVEERLLRWERDAFFGEPWRFAALTRWARAVGTGARVGEGSPPPLAVRIRREIERLAEPVLPRRPESEWDLDYFERHEYPADDSGLNPMDAVENTIRHVDFRRAWDRALGAGGDPDAELAELSRWAAREADRLHIGAAALGPPGAWPAVPRAGGN